MDRRTLIFLAVAIVVMMGIVSATGSRGLSDQTKELVAQEARELERAKDRLASVREEVSGLLAREPELYSRAGLDVALPARLERVESDVADAEKRLDAAEAIVEENDRDREQELLAMFASTAAGPGAINADLSRIEETAHLRIDFKENLDEHLARMREDHDAVDAMSLDGVESSVQRAIVDWPAKSEWLAGRLDRARTLKSESDEAWRAAAAEAESSENRDYEALITSSERLERNRAELDHLTDELRARVDQLYTSWDKVLADMDIRENGEVTFRHKYEIVKVRIEDPDSHENTTTTEEVWAPVSKRVFDANEKNLGMTVEHKPAGVFDDEAESSVQPAGLAYVASPEQGSNQYGRWQSGPGGSFWVFYGQYALMRDLFWGGGYRPIGTGHWRDYDSARRTGRTFYGRGEGGKSMYGSQGSITSTRYAGSRYKRTGGFKNTQYKQSGGTYRGSRYSSGGGRGGRSSRGGSRFGGGK